MARHLPDIAWLKFYIPESHMPRFPRADDASLSKREFHTALSKTKKHIRDLAAMVRHNMGLPPLDSQYHFPRMPVKVNDATIEWRRQQIKKTADLSNSVWLASHHPKRFPPPPDVHGSYSTRRQFHKAINLWRAAIKELVDRQRR
jgi:hypothetical protein